MPLLLAQVLLATCMEFWLTDGDCPLPGQQRAAADRPGLPAPPESPRDAWRRGSGGGGGADWLSGLQSMPSSSLR